MFAVVALGALIIGVQWPKKYDASTTILAQESSIITPLMEGAASPTANANRAGIAQAVIFSRRVMGQILVTGGWMANHPNPVEQDRLIEAIKARIALGRAGTTAEAAGGVLLFCLPESDYITGQILEVDGGLAN